MKNFLNSAKTKFLAIIGSFLGASSAFAENITIDAATGKMSGTLDLAPFLSGAAILVSALAIMWGVKRLIGLFSR